MFKFEYLIVLERKECEWLVGRERGERERGESEASFDFGFGVF